MAGIRRLAAVAVAIAALSAAHVARAQPDDPAKKKEAEGYVRQAAERYANGDRHGAVALFEKAYATYPSPVILYNLGKAYRGIGRNALAHRTLARTLADKEGLAPKHKSEAEQMMRDIERVVGLIEVVTRKGATIEVDGDEIGVAPLPYPVAVEAGVHLVVVKKGDLYVGKEQVAAGTGKRVRVQVGKITEEKPEETEPYTKGVVVPPPDVVAGNRTKISGDPDSAITKPPPEEPTASSPIYKKWWFWTAVGVAVAGTAAVVIASGGGEVNDVNPNLGQFDWQDF